MGSKLPEGITATQRPRCRFSPGQNYWALSPPAQLLAHGETTENPTHPVLLKNLDLTRSPRQAWHPNTGQALPGTHPHTASDIPQCHTVFLSVLLGFGEAACIQKMPPNTAGTSTAPPERDYSTVSWTMQEKLKLNYWGNVNKTHISLHSKDGIHRGQSPKHQSFLSASQKRN